jgi:PhoH-like ATPase
LGRLFFETHDNDVRLPPSLPGNKADNSILATAMSVQKNRPDHEVTLVTKDINLRIKARALKIRAEDYYSDQALEDVNLLPTGFTQLPADFWNTHGKQMESWKEEGRTFYRISGPLPPTWMPGQCLHLNDESNFQAIVRKLDGSEAIIELANNYMNSKNTVWGINARNIGQNFALNFLMDPDIDFVTLLGHAGTGKTLLTLAAGLAQILDMSRYREIIMTRVTVPVGEDIGFLPGTEEEKMTPWMGALMDNLEVLTGGEQAGGSWEREATNDLLRGKIKIRSVNFMRGRTFINRYVIIDEAQNLTAKQMKTLITRAGPGTKVVCLGNIAQIDTPYLTETTSGLTYVVDRFKHWEHSGHITLQRGERSRLADHASDVL